VTFPRGRFSLVVGVSGSGKSSLVDQTLGSAAAARMSTWFGVRQGEAHEERAYVGPLPASVLLRQSAFRWSSRTTVGTATGFLDLVRRLFVRRGRVTGADGTLDVPSPDGSTWARWLSTHVDGPVEVWAVPRSSAIAGAVADLARAGIQRATVFPPLGSPAQERELELSAIPGRAREGSTVEANLGRCTTLDELEGALTRAFEAGHAVVMLPAEIDPVVRGPHGPRLDSRLHRLHPEDAAVYLAPTRALLTFNTPSNPIGGACPSCGGLGRELVVRDEVLIVGPDRSLREGALALWTPKGFKYVNIKHTTVEGLARKVGFRTDVPWSTLSLEARTAVLDGLAEPFVEVDPRSGDVVSGLRTFEGLREAILSRVRGNGRHATALSPLVSDSACRSCAGTRWSPAARALRVGHLGLAELLATDFLSLPASCDRLRGAVPGATDLIDALARQAGAFAGAGVGHLTPSRGMGEVSAGEGRRLRLAGLLAAPLDDLLLVLDEPARGLHDEDVTNLAAMLDGLTPRHTIVAVDHRASLASVAHTLVEVGPGAGSAGGRLVTGSHQWRANMADRPTFKPSNYLDIPGIKHHNLAGDAVRLALGGLNAVVGVSGSGKSSFVQGVLVPALGAVLPRAERGEASTSEVSPVDLRGADALDALVVLEQGAPSRQARSLVGTWLGGLDLVRHAFAASEVAGRLGLDATSFSTNAGEGRCGACLGLGVVHDGGGVPCPRCGGERFNSYVLAVEVEGWTMADVLAAPAEEILKARPSWAQPLVSALTAMRDLGLGHLALGRPMPTLSGGEHQRLRIARTLASAPDERTLFVLDEPAAGLHPRDVEQLGLALAAMLAGGRNTVVLVEHQLDLVRWSDWLVEFGPGAGPSGGRVIAMGPPMEVAKADTPTGRALRGTHKPASYRHVNWPGLEGGPGSDEEQAERSRSWIRRLLGDEVEPPAAAASHRPKLRLEAGAQQDLRAIEVGDLHLELAALLLDLSPPADPPTPTAWDGSAWWVHADLELWACWGDRAPKAALKAASAHVRALGLEASGFTSDPATWWCSLPAPRSSAELRSLVHRWGGAVLAGAEPETATVLGPRRLDPSRGLVGPGRMLVRHLDRHSSFGRCEACGGRGSVASFDTGKVIANTRAPLSGQEALTTSAEAILKGARRQMLLPFLRALVAEGMWPSVEALYSSLDETQRAWLMHGCWSRPGHGTFLKPGKDPAEVGSWLRWDGLVTAVLGELPRSKDAAWRASIEASVREVACLRCDGSGLGVSGELVTLAGRTWSEWLREGTIGELRSALASLESKGARVQRRAGRLAAWLKAAPSGALLCDTTPAVRGALLPGAARAMLQVEVVGP
jgi:excinuclease ABC A subunit